MTVELLREKLIMKTDVQRVVGTGLLAKTMVFVTNGRYLKEDRQELTPGASVTLLPSRGCLVGGSSPKYQKIDAGDKSFNSTAKSAIDGDQIVTPGFPHSDEKQRKNKSLMNSIHGFVTSSSGKNLL